MTRDRLYAELLLRWSRTVERHGLTFEAWLANPLDSTTAVAVVCLP